MFMFNAPHDLFHTDFNLFLEPNILGKVILSFGREIILRNKSSIIIMSIFVSYAFASYLLFLINGVHEMLGNALVMKGEKERTTDVRGQALAPKAPEGEGE